MFDDGDCAEGLIERLGGNEGTMPNILYGTSWAFETKDRAALVSYLNANGFVYDGEQYYENSENTWYSFFIEEIDNYLFLNYRYNG